MNSVGVQSFGPMWGRVVDLEIGTLNSTTAMDLSKLSIDFEVRDGEGVDSTGDITVYNISQDTFDKIRNSDILVLKAGHKRGNYPRVIFSGKINSVIPAHVGGDIAYKIACTGGSGSRKITTSKKYSDSTNVFEMMRDLAKEMGLPLDLADRVVDRLKTKKYNGGVTVYGNISEELKQIAADSGLEMRLDDVAIRLMEPESGNYVETLSLSKSTGLLENLREAEVREGSVTKKGWAFKSMLFPEIKRGNRINIEDPKNGSGLYRVVSRTHIGSNYGDPFYTSGTLLEVK